MHCPSTRLKNCVVHILMTSLFKGSLNLSENDLAAYRLVTSLKGCNRETISKCRTKTLLDHYSWMKLENPDEIKAHCK